MTLRKKIFVTILAIQIIFWGVYLHHRKQLSNQLAKQIILNAHNNLSNIDFPAVATPMGQREVWLMNFVLSHTHFMKQLNGCNQPSFRGFLTSISWTKVDRAQRDFYETVNQQYPELNLGKYSHSKYTSLMDIVLPKYFARSWILMSSRLQYASYDLFGYITNLEHSAYFSQVYRVEGSYCVWGEKITFDEVHIIENVNLEKLNFEDREKFIPSHAYVKNQNMHIDERSFSQRANCAHILNPYYHQIISHNLADYKLSGDYYEDIQKIRSIWALKYGNNLYSTTNPYLDAVNHVTAHEVAHIYDIQHNLIDELQLPTPCTLHLADQMWLTYSVHTEFNAFASEVINGGYHKACLCSLLNYVDAPSPELGIGYPHGIGKNRSLYYLINTNEPNVSQQVLNLSRYIENPSEFNTKLIELKQKFVHERGQKYYHSNFWFWLLQYSYLLTILILFLLNLIFYRKYC